MQLIKVKNISSLKIKSKYFEDMNEIWIPFDLYTNKVQKNIDSFINKQTYKIDSCKNESNIDRINKLFYDGNKSIQLVAKLMMILFRIFDKYFK